MKLLQLTGPAIIALLSAAAFSSCEDEVSPIGGSITNGEVAISVDSLILKINASTVTEENIDTRSLTTLIGNINVPEYGSLAASYVTQLLSASNLQIPDTIGVERIDSLNLVLQMPRDATIGDTLAPQQLKVYRLNRQLPSDLLSDFDPTGYYDPSDAIATKNYTLSAINLQDTAFRKQTVLSVSYRLPHEWATDIFTAYRNNATEFQWPQEFNKVFPGLYVMPSFGRGAMANVQNTKMFLHYHYYITRNQVVDNVAVPTQVTVRDSVCIFSSSPEVLSSTILKYTPSASLQNLVSEGKKIISAPTGYRVKLQFPAEDILKQYWASDHNLAVINNLTFALPVTSVTNDYGILPPPELLMIRTCDIEEFFANNKIPDNKTSFRGTYSSLKGRYEFASMREYIVSLKNKGQQIAPEDVDFTLIPVSFTTESVTSQYDGSATLYITGCSPYIESPRMAVIDTDRATVVFTYSRQLLK